MIQTLIKRLGVVLWSAVILIMNRSISQVIFLKYPSLSSDQTIDDIKICDDAYIVTRQKNGTEKCK